MIPPLFLDSRLQQRHRTLAHDPRGPVVHGGPAPTSANHRRAQARRASPPGHALRVSPFPPGWSGEEGVALEYRFHQEPPSLLAWAQSDEVFAKQGRDQVWPRVLTILLPDETPLFTVAGELDALDRLDISVGNRTETVLYRWQLQAGLRR